nr:PREDICTED: uncharacterized protein LOC109037472 [Bemisia tabaci]
MARVFTLLVAVFLKSLEDLVPSASAKESVSANAPKSDLVQVPESSDFAVIRHSKAFIDKTDFIHEWILHQPVHLSVSAPPGSGKSALLSMVRHFCNASAKIQDGALIYPVDGDSQTCELFRDTTVAKLKDFHDRHFQKYSVVNVAFAPLRNSTDRASFEQNFCSVMRDMINDYQFLTDVNSLNESEKAFLKDYKDHDKMCRQDFESATKQHGPRLVSIVQKHLASSVIVLVDDVDAVLDAFATHDGAESFAEFAISTIRCFILAFILNERGLSEGPVASKLLMMSSFELGMVIPGDVDKLITGVEFDRSPRLGTYFGLKYAEVEKLLANYALQDHSRLVADLYDGHTVVRSPSIFNTEAVLKFIKNRGNPLPPETPSAVLRDFEKLFSDVWIGLAMTSCVFDGTFAMSAIYQTRYQNLLALRQKLRKVSPFQTDFKLSTLDHEIFIKLLIRSGLLQVLEDFVLFELGFDVTYHRLAPTNYFAAGILRDYLYKSGYVEKFFGVRAKDEIAITEAFRNLAPTIASIDKLKDAVHGIVQMRDPEDDTNLKALMYTFARKTADHYSKELVVDAGIIAHSKNEEKAKSRKGKSTKGGKVDVLLVQKEKCLGVVIVTRYGGNATSLVKDVANHAYTDIFDTNLVYSKYKIKDRMLLAVAVSRKGVDVYGEVYGSTGTITLGARRKLSHQ